MSTSPDVGGSTPSVAGLIVYNVAIVAAVLAFLGLALLGDPTQSGASTSAAAQMACAALPCTVFYRTLSTTLEWSLLRNGRGIWITVIRVAVGFLVLIAAVTLGATGTLDELNKADDSHWYLQPAALAMSSFISLEFTALLFVWAVNAMLPVESPPDYPAPNDRSQYTSLDPAPYGHAPQRQRPTMYTDNRRQPGLQGRARHPSRLEGPFLAYFGILLGATSVAQAYDGQIRALMAKIGVGVLVMILAIGIAHLLRVFQHADDT